MNSRRTSGLKDRGETAAVSFDLPLLLSPTENLRGFLLNLAGRAALFAVAATSVLVILLIFVFITREAALFFCPDDASTGWLQGFWQQAGKLFGGTA